MKTIWKLSLNPSVGQAIYEVSADSRVVNVTADPDGSNKVAVYIETTPNLLPKQTFKLFLTGTGHSLDESYEYLGTAICPPFAWHAWKAYK
jgi:hypothetical protein